MKRAVLGAVIVTGAVLFAGLVTPVSAASLATDTFLANLTPNVDFLDRSSRFALDNAKSAKLKAFALSQAREQTLAANAIDEWIDARKAVAIAATTGEDGVVTGRSVAIDPPAAAPTAPVQLQDMRLPMGQEDLDLLEGLTGTDFDTTYKTKQIDALTQIKTDYQDYLAKGDDPVLLKMAKAELPKVTQRLAALRKM